MRPGNVLLRGSCSKVTVPNTYLVATLLAAQWHVYFHPVSLLAVTYLRAITNTQ